MSYKEEQIKYKIRQDFKTMLYAKFGSVSVTFTKMSLWVLRQSVTFAIFNLEWNRWYAEQMLTSTNDNSWYEEISLLDEMIDELKLMLS